MSAPDSTNSPAEPQAAAPTRLHPIRVLVAKPGLDGHDRGAKVVARALRDAGMEVVYTGIRQTPEMIAAAAAQEDVDVVGLSILSGAHLTLLPRIVELLREQGMGHVLVVAGGIIPAADVPVLQSAGISAVFGPGTRLEAIATYVRQHAPGRQSGDIEDDDPQPNDAPRSGP